MEQWVKVLLLDCDQLWYSDRYIVGYKRSAVWESMRQLE